MNADDAKTVEEIQERIRKALLGFIERLEAENAALRSQQAKLNLGWAERVAKLQEVREAADKCRGPLDPVDPPVIVSLHAGWFDKLHEALARCEEEETT